MQELKERNQESLEVLDNWSTELESHSDEVEKARLPLFNEYFEERDVSTN